MQWLSTWAPDLTNPVVNFAVPVAFPVTCLAVLSALSPNPTRTPAVPDNIAQVVRTAAHKLAQATAETAPDKCLEKSRHAQGIVYALVALHGRDAVDNASGFDTAAMQKRLRTIGRNARTELAELRAGAQRVDGVKWPQPATSVHRR